LALLIALTATAAAANGPAPRWYVQVDNDLVFGTDRWYSSGVRIARVTTSGDTLNEWGLLQEVYTPEAKYWDPGVDDRSPTARLLAYGARHWKAPESFTTFEATLGVRGPSALGEEVTRAIHKIISAPKVDWSRQDSDQVDAQVALVRSQRISDFYIHYGAVAGTEQVFGHAGVEWRVGPPSTQAALSPAMRYVATPPPAAGECGWGAFVGASVRAVASNRMIRRNYDPYGPELEPRHTVGRAVLGINTVQDWGSLTFALVQDTREFDAQRKPQAFGSLTVHVEF
jgi:lipid A 3-O-deacylase